MHGICHISTGAQASNNAETAFYEKGHVMGLFDKLFGSKKPVKPEAKLMQTA